MYMCSACKHHFLGAEAARWGETMGEGRWGGRQAGWPFLVRQGQQGFGKPGSGSCWSAALDLHPVHMASHLKPLLDPCCSASSNAQPCTHPGASRCPPTPRVVLPCRGTCSGPIHLRHAEKLADLMHQVDYGWMDALPWEDGKHWVDVAVGGLWWIPDSQEAFGYECVRGPPRAAEEKMRGTGLDPSGAQERAGHLCQGRGVRCLRRKGVKLQGELGRERSRALCQRR